MSCLAVACAAACADEKGTSAGAGGDRAGNPMPVDGGGSPGSGGISLSSGGTGGSSWDASGSTSGGGSVDAGSDITSGGSSPDTAAPSDSGSATLDGGDSGGPTPDAGVAPDSGSVTPDSGDSGAVVPPIVLGPPIDAAPNELWTWVPIEGTRCADGTEAGVGVNFTTESRDLVIFFQGGGVCLNKFTCEMFDYLLTGMGPYPLVRLGVRNVGIFDRTNPGNPLRNSNFIVFPHCGVDGHTADKESTYPPLPTIQQRGYGNVTIALPRIVSTFFDASQIVVAGFSAGGIGAGANYHQIATAFEAVGKAPPILIDDAGPVLRPPYLGPLAQSLLRSGWGLDKTIEPWCPECVTEGYHAVHEAIARLHPGVRSSVICSYNDDTVRALYALLNLDDTFTGATLDAGLRDLSAWSASFQAEVAPSAQREFFYPGTRHGALTVDSLDATPGLVEFLTAQLDASPTWATVHQ